VYTIWCILFGVYYLVYTIWYLDNDGGHMVLCSL